MASEYIGLIVGQMTRTCYSVFNPDDDAELDNPQLLLLQNEEKEPVQMVKVARGDYSRCMSLEGLHNLIGAYYAKHGL
jgi:hypothetical protein